MVKHSNGKPVHSMSSKQTKDDTVVVSDETKIDLSSINKTEKKKRDSLKFNISFSNLFKKQDRKRDKRGRFAAIGSGGLQSLRDMNIKRLLPVVVVISLVGGFLVYQSFAASNASKNEVTKWYRTCLNREPDSGGLDYWAGQLDKNPNATWSIADKFMKTSKVTSCNYANTPKNTTGTTTATQQPASTSSSSGSSSSSSSASSNSSAATNKVVCSAKEKGGKYVLQWTTTTTQWLWKTRVSEKGGAVLASGLELNRDDKSNPANWPVPDQKSSKTYRVSLYNPDKGSSSKEEAASECAVTIKAAQTSSTNTGSQSQATNQANEADKAWLIAQYQEILGRSPSRIDPAGFQYWLNRLKTESRDSVKKALSNTAEAKKWAALRQQTGSSSSSSSSSASQSGQSGQSGSNSSSSSSSTAPAAPADPEDEAWLRTQYQDLLCRSPDKITQEDLKYWLDRLSKKESRDSVKKAISTTSEAIRCADSKSTATDETWLRAQYYGLFCRPLNMIDSDGFKYWLDRLKKESRSSVKQAMSNTAEAKRCAESKNPTSSSQSQSQTQQQEAGPNPHTCVSPYPTLKRNDKNKSADRKDECVSAVQYNLKKGANDVAVTGTVDDKTVSAIQNFQKFFQLPVTGTLTPQQVESIATIWGPYATAEEEEEAETEVSGEGKLDVVFMGDGVSDDAVSSAASRFGSALLAFPPYSQYKDRIAIHTITERPSCNNTQVDSVAGPFTSVSCNVAQTATASGVPTDKVVVISSSVGREHAGGSSMSISLSTSNTTFLHEMGHVMGLADEYHSYDDSMWGEQSLTTQGQCITATSSTDTSMFFNGSWKDVEGPWSAWTGLSNVNWHRECGSTQWLRPSENSLMRNSMYGGGYNSVSEYIVKNELERHMTGAESTLSGYGSTSSSSGGIFSR